MRVQLQAAYCIHSRNYRESSQILELLTSDHGLISCVYRGARKKNGSNEFGFTPLLISWSGRGDLFTLTNMETIGPRHITSAKLSIIGIYLNELILKLVPKLSPSKELFCLYEDSISFINENENEKQERLLRLFEIRLLEIIGHGLSLDKELDHETPIQHDQIYRYDVGIGAIRVAYESTGWNVINGSTLLGLQTPLQMDIAYLKEAKQLMRGILNWHLSNKTIHSREILQYIQA